jgi:hypothetical protein
MESKLKPSRDQFYKYINGVLSEDQAHDFYNTYDLENQVYEENGKFGLVNCLDELLLLPLFDNFMLLSSKPLVPGHKVVSQQNGLWGIVKLDGGLGECIVEPIYEYISYPNTIVACYKNKKWGILNTTTNEFIIPMICDHISLENGFIFCNGIGTFEIDGKCGVMRDVGEHTEAIFDEVELDFDQVVKVRIGEVWGYINAGGKFTEDSDEAYYWCGV